MQNEVPELKAMGVIASEFANLKDDEIQRVMRWANERYRGKGAGFVASATAASGANSGGDTQYADLPSIIDAAKPTNGLERILVAAYFYQVVKGESDFDSQSVNTQLKHLGFPSANITRDMVRLADRSPKLVLQTRKEGSAQQARKRFRLTTEGTRAVQEMLRKSQGSTE